MDKRGIKGKVCPVDPKPIKGGQMSESTHKEPKTLSECSIVMRGKVKVGIGARVKYPYSVEVAAGEPSSVKNFHAKYADKEGVVVEIKNRPNVYSDGTTIFFKVRFSDGFEQDDMHPDFLIYLGPPEKK